jgi:hypothetical protein
MKHKGRKTQMMAALRIIAVEETIGLFSNLFLLTPQGDRSTITLQWLLPKCIWSSANNLHEKCTIVAWKCVPPDHFLKKGRVWSTDGFRQSAPS